MCVLQKVLSEMFSMVQAQTLKDLISSLYLYMLFYSKKKKQNKYAIVNDTILFFLKNVSIELWTS